MKRATHGFNKILIANRGEIAVRILRTVKRLGLRSVAVYSDADRDAPHAQMADEAVHLGESTPSASYLSIERLLAAARATKADALHPGYGFLSENAALARACGENGITFIGPLPESIGLMGDKAAAKRRMIEAGVPCIPGYQGEIQDDATLIREAAAIGFPIMVKAAAGGGGRGLRRVDDAKQLPEALRAARSEARHAFGADELILERALAGPRHVEIQVFADRHGNAIHLGERDCSIQRRHQKVIEESPSPAVTPDLRARMGEAAIAAARAVDYHGAGTIEFLLDRDGHFYFLERNTRLQVEHPVTELVTGQDLVEWQIKIAAGDRLPLTQDAVRLHGHAVEARLYAEDPAQQFLPQAGHVLLWEPPAGDGVRVDHGLRSGLEITPYYDPMIAKIVAFGEARDEARRRLIDALEHCAVLGVPTNRTFLIDCLEHEEFADGTATTAFIDTHFSAERLARKAPDDETLAVAAVLLYRRDAPDVPALLADWRSTGPAPVPLLLDDGDKRSRVEVTALGNRQYEVTLPDGRRGITILETRDNGHLRYELDEHESEAHFAFDREVLHLAAGRVTARIEDRMLSSATAASESAADGRVLSAMNGTVTAIHVRAGDQVTRGQPLIVLEAMKMEHVIAAPIDGKVANVAVAVGKPVANRQLLIELEPSTPPDVKREDSSAVPESTQRRSN
jgi:geranyl-CoA carboxylase alpha subunit